MIFEPKMIHIDLTGKCNLKCLHCRGMVNDVDLDKYDVYNIISNIFTLWKTSIDIIELGGGEALLHKDLSSIIKYIKKLSRKTKVSIVSNGYFFDEEMANLLKESGLDQIQFSLDGAIQSTHNWLRGNDKSFQKVISAIKISKELNLKVVLRITVHKKNIDEIEDFFRLVRSVGVSEISIRGCIYVGSAEVSKEKLYLAKEDYSILLKQIPVLSKKYSVNYFSGDPLSLIADHDALNKILNKYGSYDKLYAGCSVGIKYLYINNNGEIGFCPMLSDIVIGDAKSLNNLKETWEKSEIFAKSRNRAIEGKCFYCKYKRICGSCSANSFWYNKKLFSENPMCDFFEEK